MLSTHSDGTGAFDSSVDVPKIRRDRLLKRFLQYVAVDTTADPDRAAYPSSTGQSDFTNHLADQLRAMGLVDVVQDPYGLVYATIPATVGHDAPTVALVAHVDTSPEAPGAGVSPRVIESYDGDDIELNNGSVIRRETVDDMDALVGKTLVVTDGTTLLGGDDKAGVAIIMELAETLIENPHLRHGPVRLLFTCDEEIGSGTKYIDLERLAAMVAYTIDGGAAGIIDVETFSADGASVTFTGHNIHPSIAKGRMVNAVRAAADFVAALPRTDTTPETTDGRDGFIHPHTITGGVGEATVRLIMRSFDNDDLITYAETIRGVADAVVEATPGLRARVEVHPQYRNLGEGLRKLPESVDLAIQAFENLQRPHRKMIIRGGTDGSQLTEMGLPTPNLSSGQYNIHSTGEFACLDDMIESTEHLVELLRLWGDQAS